MQWRQGHYTIQGLNVVDICSEFGTPLYVYDAQTIDTQIRTLRAAFAECNMKIKYAAKALPNISVLALIRRNNCGIDAVSKNEIDLALRAGFAPQDIIFTPSCVHFDEIVEAVNLGTTVNLDNLPLLEKFAQKYEASYPCCIRVNPDILAGGNAKISTGHAYSKFGISLSQLPEIIEIVARYGLCVNGLHIHTGSELPSVEIFLQVAETLFGVAHKFPSLEFLDLGGGFKVPSREGEEVPDIYRIGSKMSKSLHTFCKAYGRSLELWIEPGKYLVSPAGHFFVSVNVVKETSSVVFVGVDSGLNHFVRPMMYDAYHEIMNVSNSSGSPKFYTVVGNICETDTFGVDREIPEVREDDLLAIKNAGAYGYSMASNFNSRFRPAEVLVENGKAKLVRRRETFNELIQGQL